MLRHCQTPTPYFCAQDTSPLRSNETTLIFQLFFKSFLWQRIIKDWTTSSSSVAAPRTIAAIEDPVSAVVVAVLEEEHVLSAVVETKDPKQCSSWRGPDDDRTANDVVTTMKTTTVKGLVEGTTGWTRCQEN